MKVQLKNSFFNVSEKMLGSDLLGIHIRKENRNRYLFRFFFACAKVSGILMFVFNFLRGAIQYVSKVFHNTKNQQKPALFWLRRNISGFYNLAFERVSITKRIHNQSN